MFSRNRNTLMRCLVIAGYLLATTASGLFHDHRGEPHCTAGRHCHHAGGHTTAFAGALAGTGSTGSHSPTGSRHSHSGKCCHQHSPGDERLTASSPKLAGSCGKVREASPARSPGLHSHEEHGPCAVCQFLAQHQAVAAPTSPLTALRDAVPTRVLVRQERPSLLVVAHPGRGPPSA